jgi:hypothetical protein
MHDRIDYVVHSMLASQLSDPSGARGQVVGLLSQPIARQALSGSFGYELGATGAMLAVAVLGFLAFRYPQRHPGRPVVAQFWNAMSGQQAASQFWNATAGLAEGHAEADLPLHAERVSWLREFIRVPVIGVTQTCHRFTVHAAPACGPV